MRLEAAQTAGAAPSVESLHSSTNALIFQEKNLKNFYGPPNVSTSSKGFYGDMFNVIPQLCTFPLQTDCTRSTKAPA